MVQPGGETVFTYGAPSLKFGVGAIEEIGWDVAQLGARRALIVTDAGVAATGTPERVRAALGAHDIEAVVYDEVHVEPTDDSLRHAAETASSNAPYDVVIAVGGGSSIDTAKAVNLLLTNPGDLMDYVNPPVGGGQAPTKPLLPLVAVPTTTGTGAESTTICVLDVLAQHVKTGISHPRLRPTMAVVDPSVTVTQPTGVTAASGMDILCHALESYTARPFTSYSRKSAGQRVPYCGANPIADMWGERAMALLASSFRTAVNHGDDLDSRTDMALAATMAGLGFGNAGVHLPHANAYPIAGRAKVFHPTDYPGDEPLVPHGMAVSLTAPESFRFTFDAAPERHLAAARILAGDREVGDGPDALAGVLIGIMRDVGIPSGIGAVGYDDSDISDLVDGTLKQQRLLATAPKSVDADDVAGVFRRSIANW